MKVIQHGRRPGERRQRSTYDKDGRVLIAGTRERQRITLDGKPAAPDGSKAAPAPKPPAVKAAPVAKAEQAAPSPPGKLFPGMRPAQTTTAQAKR